ncbi:FkbM family methyltransferase [Methylobacterium sp. E-016]|uniref:FkbM family methyltransferase n=1 Tax=Methylobacterium sp. E-016 TaxID=2836556 RepID=UPI001FBAB8DA|nr:FkbM family methyltransferase [Methylobacterium sp. E-016]
MTPEDYVRSLYLTTLGREADPDGLAACVTLIAETGDPTLVLEGLLSSAEYALRSTRPAFDEALIPTCVAHLNGRPVTIIDVGAQMLGTEEHAYQALCRPDIPHHIIGFEPLSDRVHEREASENGGALTMLPYAIGDGKTHTLYVNNDDATSSIYPLHLPLTSRFEHLHTLRVERTLSVATRTLDDVVDHGPIDFLKLDIQGAELMALQGAERMLARTGVIHCEVEFAEIYKGQYLFPEVQLFLNARGFSLIDILVPHRYAYVTQSNVDSRDRLIWGDAVFFRETEDKDTLAVQAMIAGLVYSKASLSSHLIERAHQKY